MIEVAIALYFIVAGVVIWRLGRVDGWRRSPEVERTITVRLTADVSQFAAALNRCITRPLTRRRPRFARFVPHRGVAWPRPRVVFHPGSVQLSDVPSIDDVERALRRRERARR